MGIGHSSGFCIGHWILFCTVMDGGVASDKLPCSLSCLVCSSAAGLLFNPDVSLMLSICSTVSWRGSLLSGMRRLIVIWPLERNVRTYCIRFCSPVQLHTAPNKQNASMCVRCWKGEKQTMKTSRSFSFPLFQNLGLKFRVAVHQSFPLKKHKR